jgi:putative sterol carrier protein
VWKKISFGEMNGSWAFKRRRYRMKGGSVLLMKLNKLIKGGQPSRKR